MHNLMLEDNNDYLDEKTKKVISKCYQILESRNSIVGEKAQDDIARLFTVHILKLEFKNTTSELYKKCRELKDFQDKEYFINCIIDLKKLADKGVSRILHQWKLFVKHVLIDVLEYDEIDMNFNCNDATTVGHLILTLSNELEINEEYIDFFVDKYEGVNELFRLIKNDVIV